MHEVSASVDTTPMTAATMLLSFRVSRRLFSGPKAKFMVGLLEEAVGLVVEIRLVDRAVVGAASGFWLAEFQILRRSSCLHVRGPELVGNVVFVSVHACARSDANSLQSSQGVHPNWTLLALPARMVRRALLPITVASRAGADERMITHDLNGVVRAPSVRCSVPGVKPSVLVEESGRLDRR